ncbi:class II aldolase/adducin family protein [Thetidibacter halocola]|uniref:Class II aldolase/adducin family protein n=1 Tax=Thetidibacter halocola TaxID=2827239 RepID=A0A8J8BC00_9RHOB|nr:class II aldolase/adducin family protein [Thetidibacter halocola]MBS0126753.1 class II aldolase/adducin family protein [Thetidibacter halocola]
MTVPNDTAALRQSIIDACLWLNARGINQGTAGNVSVRVPDGMLITPSGIPYETMTPDMIVFMPLDRDPPIGLRPSSEWRFHQRLLAARPDMMAVVHAHPPYCSVLAVQRRAIPAVHYMIAAFGGHDVPLVPYSLFGGEELATNVAAAMAERHGCLMANHGATVLGESLDRALWRMEELETLARTYLFSAIGGAPHLLNRAQIDEALVAFASYGPRRNDG